MSTGLLQLYKLTQKSDLRVQMRKPEEEGAVRFSFAGVHLRPHYSNSDKTHTLQDAMNDVVF